jgi:hypothetical protein
VAIIVGAAPMMRIYRPMDEAGTRECLARLDHNGELELLGVVALGPDGWTAIECRRDAGSGRPEPVRCHGPARAFMHQAGDDLAGFASAAKNRPQPRRTVR